MHWKRLLPVVIATAMSAVAQVPNFTPPTPLIGAALTNNTDAVRKLLDAGAEPNEGRFIGGRTPIFFAMMHKNRDMADAMIAKGADVNAADESGSTPLMWAANDETGDPALVNRLLALGADPNVKNKGGETALTWAMRRGYTPVVEALKKSGATDTEMVKESAEKAIALLLKSGPQFVKVSGCYSCHNQSLPQMAYSVARTRGYAVEKAPAEYNVKAVIALFKPYVPELLKGTPAIPDPAVSVSYALVGLAAENYHPDETTAAMAHLISLQQLPDGSFGVFPARPPIESSLFSSTALSLRALQVYGKDPEPAVRKAAAWLASATPRTTEERAMQLLGLAWADGDSAAMKKGAKDLLAEQRADGGWPQLPGIETDAYATGQAMVAIMTAGQIGTSDPAWQRAQAYLLRTQLEDGSWLVRTRSFPFQPYKESGFPHGKNQWISATGTSWAVWALSLGQPVKGMEASRSSAME
jgi:ankyrin repeat protein